MPVLLPTRRIIYTLGCWAKGDSVPLTSGTGRKFGIVLRFINNDVIVGEETASFNPDCSSQNDWQYLSMRVAAKTAYTSLRIILVYECNANVVYFDGVQLFNTYGPWGESRGVSGTLASTLGAMNPLRYRGYVYDTETGLYYLNSRYYNPTWGRFINADNQITTGSDLTGTNLFAYCGNNPVNRTDPTGEAWWHWALGAAVVAAAAVATVVICGGFAAAATAVCMVGGGVAAATTASTVAAGAFIGPATVYGMAVVTAASTSSSIKEFNNQGNWGTVAATAGGAILGGGSAYVFPFWCLDEYEQV